MKAGDLVRCALSWDMYKELGVFLGYEGSKHHSYVLVRGEKLMFLTRELEKVNEGTKQILIQGGRPHKEQEHGQVQHRD